MNQKLKIITFIIISFLFIQPLIGQTIPYLKFDKINIDTDVLTTRCIIQGTDGIMWIGANQGIFSYDGYSLSKQNITNNYIPKIHCGVLYSGTIYFGTDNGLTSFNEATGEYYNLKLPDIKDINCMTLYNDELWIGTIDGLFCYNIKSQSLIKFPTNKLPNKAVYSIIKGTDGNLYVGTYNGLCRIKNNQIVETIKIPNTNKWKNLFINTLLEDKENHRIWIGTEGNLFCYHTETSIIECIPNFTNNSIKTLNLDKTKQLYIGTDNGLFVYSYNLKSWKHFTRDSRNDYSLSNNIIWCITIDKNDNIWLGTDNGISFVNNHKNYTFVPIWEMLDSNKGNLFYSILLDSQKNYWLGGSDGLLQIRKKDKGTIGKWFQVGNSKYTLTHNRIRYIYEDKSNDLWIATDGSVEKYDYKNAKFTHYTIIDSTNTYNSNWAYCIFEDHQNNLWISTCLGGIFIVNKKKLKENNNKIYIADKNFTTKDGLKSMFVKQIVPDVTGNVWVLMYNVKNIQKINNNNNKIYTYSFNCMKNDEYPEFIISDTEGMIWICTNYKIYKINPITNKIIKKTWTIKNNSVLSMTEINENIWVSSAKGIYCINKQNLKAKRIYLNGYFNSIFYDKINKEIILGGTDGIGICHPDILKTTEHNSQIHLTAASVNNEIIPRANITNGKFIFSYTENNLLFKFSDYQYDNSRKTHFMYFMKGLDSKWHYVNTNSNVIVYNNIPHGEYTLYVKNTDTPNNKYQIAEIKILPPWYLSPQAQIIYIVLGIGTIIGFISFFNTKNRLRIAQLEKKQILEQTKQKIRFMSNLSHDLKDPISMIIAPISKLLLDTKDIKEKEILNIAHKNAINLSAKIQKIIEINRIEDNENILILSKIELVSFIQTIFNNFKFSEIEYKHNWIFETNIGKLFVEMDTTKLESIIHNLLSNAMKYTPKEKEIIVTINYNNKTEKVILKIENKGIEIPLKEQPYIFQRFFQSSQTKNYHKGTGIGLYLVKMYTELHKGSIKVSSNQTSTIFSLTFPIDKELNNTINTILHTNNEDINNTQLPTIIIVDDNKDIYKFIKNIFLNQYKCIYAANGKEALDIINKNKIDLIITDFIMPVMDGLAMCKILKKIYQQPLFL